MWSNVGRAPRPGGGLGQEPDPDQVHAEGEVAQQPPPRPSVEAWKAQAAPDRVIRSHSVLPSTSKELQSSEVPLVTTVTAVGLSCGEYSKQSLAQSRSAASSGQTRVVHARELHAHLGREREVAGGSPTNRPASGTCSVPPGSTNMSVCAAAVSVAPPLLTRHPGGGLPAGSSANGRLGSFNAVTRVVSHDPPRRFCHTLALVLNTCSIQIGRARVSRPSVCGASRRRRVPGRAARGAAGAAGGADL